MSRHKKIKSDIIFYRCDSPDCQKDKFGRKRKACFMDFNKGLSYCSSCINLIHSEKGVSFELKTKENENK